MVRMEDLVVGETFRTKRVEVSQMAGWSRKVLVVRVGVKVTAKDEMCGWVFGSSGGRTAIQT